MSDLQQLFRDALRDPKDGSKLVALGDTHAEFATANRYRCVDGRPILIAETGEEGDARVPWLRYVCDEVRAAQAQGVPVLGICLYPVTDYPGWINERHCPTGVLGLPEADGTRPVHAPLAAELRHQQALFAAQHRTLATGRELPATEAA